MFLPTDRIGGARDLAPELDERRVTGGRLPMAVAEIEDDLHAAAGEYGVFERYGRARLVAIVAFDVLF